MPPKKKPPASKEELLRIWQRVDKNNTGTVTVEEALQQASFLSSACPGFIESFEQVAKGGKVTRKAFLDFCLGKSGRSSPEEKLVDQEVVLSDLKRIFDEIVGPGGGELRLADLVEHKAKIKAVCPDLLENFTNADLDGSCTLSWDELKVFAAGTDEWLEYQFDRIIGLGVLKDQVRQFHRSVVLDNKRREAGHDVKTGGKYHMIFQGNPGTGKTTVARLVAQLLNRIGIIKSDLLVEVQRDKLVAEYVGQTGPKTQKVIEEAKDGILFVDEAYRLSQNGGKSDFGKEAIEQLMGAMNEPPGKAPVMVFAGYPDDMDAFMKANSGLYRRIAYTFDFTDYSPLDLSQILNGIAKAAGFTFACNLTDNNFARLATLIEENTLPQARELMNGGICERIFTFAKQSLDSREAAAGSKKDPSVELLESDVLEACRRIPPPPPRDSGDAPAGGDSPDVTVLRARAEKAEARCVALEADRSALRSQLASAGVTPAVPASAGTTTGGSAGSGVVAPPSAYEVWPCLRYSFGCVYYFTVVILTFIWQKLCQLGSFISSKVSGKNSTAVVPVAGGSDPSSAASADPSASGKP